MPPKIENVVLVFGLLRYDFLYHILVFDGGLHERIRFDLVNDCRTEVLARVAAFDLGFGHRNVHEAMVTRGGRHDGTEEVDFVAVVLVGVGDRGQRDNRHVVVYIQSLGNRVHVICNDAVVGRFFSDNGCLGFLYGLVLDFGLGPRLMYRARWLCSYGVRNLRK